MLELVHAVSTLLMVGVIWIVQVVHYPLFAQVGADAFKAYERAHVRRISWVVMPLMLAELGTAVALPWFSSALTDVQAWTGLGLVVAIWLTTFFVQVPLHGRLEGGYDAAVIRRLVRTNWIRTILWTARGALVVSTLAR